MKFLILLFLWIGHATLPTSSFTNIEMLRVVTRSLHQRCFKSLSHPPSLFHPSPVFWSSRLLGHKRGTVGNPPGIISIFNEQSALTNIDIAQLERTIHDIRDRLGYGTYDVTLVLTDDVQMKQLNQESRGIDAPTDILSFPFQDVIVEPGQLDEPDFDIPEYYNLGDMFIDVPYVIRRCRQDKETNETNVKEDYIERGVSGAMSTIYDPEIRINMLLVHGILHLVGYDHIEDDDYELMVTKEEHILDQLDLGKLERRLDT